MVKMMFVAVFIHLLDYCFLIAQWHGSIYLMIFYVFTEQKNQPIRGKIFFHVHKTQYLKGGETFGNSSEVLEHYLTGVKAGKSFFLILQN